MRILTRRLYRAFPELDRFSDVQCRRLMRRVQLEAWARGAVTASAIIAFAVAFVLVLALLLATEVFAPAEELFPDADVLFFLLCVFLVPALVGALTRDRVLRRFLIKAIRLRIDRVRCLGCKYILIGQRAEEGAVTCPECGRTNLLLELGIAEADLIPPQDELDWLTSEVAADRQQA
jgi:ribosomal protein S27E